MKQEKPVKQVISLAKRNKGLLVGATLGTMVIPVVGTIVGGAIGSLWDD